MFRKSNYTMLEFILTFFFCRATEQHDKDKTGYNTGDRDECGSTVWLIALGLTSKAHRVAMRPLDPCPFFSLNLYLWNCLRRLKGLSRWHYNIWMELRVFRRQYVRFSTRPQSRHPRHVRCSCWTVKISLRAREELGFFYSPSFIWRGVVTFAMYFTEASRVSCQGLNSTGGILRSSTITVPIPLLAEWKAQPQYKQ